MQIGLHLSTLTMRHDRRDVGAGALGAAAAAAAAALRPSGSNPAGSPPVPAAPLTPAKAAGTSHAQAAMLHGMRVDVPRLQALVQEQAAAAGEPLQQAWHEAQAVLLQHAVQHLVCRLESMQPPPTHQVGNALRGCAGGGSMMQRRRQPVARRCCASCLPTSAAVQAKLTAGVSYVVHTESQQQGADGLPCLPHLGERGRLVWSRAAWAAESDAQQSIKCLGSGPL